MSRIHRLLLTTPLLGATLVIGGSEASQAAHVNDSSKTRVANPANHSLTSAFKPPKPKNKQDAPGEQLSGEPFAQGFRLGYSTGYSDGSKACRAPRKQARAERDKNVRSSVDAFRQGFSTGYPAGFSAGCAAAKHG